MSVAINAGERPRAAAFGSDPRPFLESANGLRPLPAAAAFGRFQGRSLFEVKQEKNGRACQRWDPMNTCGIWSLKEPTALFNVKEI